MKVKVVVHPNSKNPRIVKDLVNTLHVYVREPALDGKANDAVVKSLAEYYMVPKTFVRIMAGKRAKSKLVEVSSI